MRKALPIALAALSYGCSDVGAPDAFGDESSTSGDVVVPGSETSESTDGSEGTTWEPTDDTGSDSTDSGSDAGEDLWTVEECLAYTYPPALEAEIFQQQYDQFPWSGAIICEESPHCVRSYELMDVVAALEPSHDHVTHYVMDKGLTNGTNMLALANDHILEFYDMGTVVRNAWKHHAQLAKQPLDTPGCTLDQLIQNDLIRVFDHNSDWFPWDGLDVQANLCNFAELTPEEEALAQKKAESTLMYVQAHEVTHLLEEHNDIKYCLFNNAQLSDEEYSFYSVQFESDSDAGARYKTFEYCELGTETTAECAIEPDSGLMMYRVFLVLEETEFPWFAKEQIYRTLMPHEKTVISEIPQKPYVGDISTGTTPVNYPSHPETQERYMLHAQDMVDFGFGYLVTQFESVE